MAIILSERPEKSDNVLPLSVSKVKTFESCKAKYRFSYIEKLPQKDWEFLIFGKFIHEVLEHFHKVLIEDATQDYYVVMTQCFKNAYSNWKDKLSPTQRTEIFDILKEYIKQMIEQRDAGVLPIFISAEKSFYLDIDGKIMLQGFIDRTQIDHDGMIHIADYKSSKDKKWLKNDFFQLMTYAFVMFLEDPELKRVRTSYIMLKHNFDMIIKEFDRDEIMGPVEEKFLKYADQINTEKLFRPSPQFLCSYCSYSDLSDSGKPICKEGYDAVNKIKGAIDPEFGATGW